MPAHQANIRSRRSPEFLPDPSTEKTVPQQVIQHLVKPGHVVARIKNIGQRVKTVPGTLRKSGRSIEGRVRAQFAAGPSCINRPRISTPFLVPPESPSIEVMTRIRPKELAYQPTVNAERIGQQDEALRSHPVLFQSPWDEDKWDGSEHESPMGSQVPGSINRGPSVRMKESLKVALWPPPPTSDATLTQSESQHDTGDPKIKLEEDISLCCCVSLSSCGQYGQAGPASTKDAKLTRCCDQLRQELSHARQEGKWATRLAENIFRTAREWDPSLPDKLGRRGSAVTLWRGVEALQTLTVRWRYQIEWHHRNVPGLQKAYEETHPMLFNSEEFPRQWG